jgi:hypothetical protein
MLPGVSPGQCSLLFGAVNDRIHDLLQSAEPDLPGEFLCECGWECGRRVQLLPVEFAALREAGETVRSPDCGARMSGHHVSRVADGVPAAG